MRKQIRYQLQLIDFNQSIASLISSEHRSIAVADGLAQPGIATGGVFEVSGFAYVGGALAPKTAGESFAAEHRA
jgi:hypothetical protein